eukprot:5969936-Alexandrium_andersonii.AAC.1
MSASLVGSEMCIRDSRPVLAEHRGERRWRASRVHSAGTAMGWGCNGAVSYTHLTLPTICSV